MVTRSIIAQKLDSYLQGSETVEQLVDWAERSLMDEDLDSGNIEVISDALARIGLADVREFGLTWRDCRDILESLGYRARVDVTAA